MTDIMVLQRLGQNFIIAKTLNKSICVAVLAQVLNA